LTHRDDEFAAANVQRAFSQTPSVLHDAKPAGKLDAMTLGSATHLVFEQIDLSKSVDAKAVAATLSQLVETGQLTKSIAAAIDTNSIVTFFDSELGQLAQKAPSSVLREWAFTYGLDASTVGAQSENEIIVLQGIVDMIIPTEKGLVIVDFKTDRITEDQINERAKKYTVQIRSYVKAASDILKQPVAATWLYFLTPKKAVEVPIVIGK
jgi:ATP-dependent helicase/nuclease subunit A